MERANLVEGRNEAETVVLKFFQLIMNRDLLAFEKIWALDAIQEIPFPPEIPGFDPVWRGKKKILAYFNSAMPGRRDHAFDIECVHSTTDVDLVIIEARAHSIVASSGRAYEQRYIFIFRVCGGKIILNKEYFNPLNYMATFAPESVHAMHPDLGISVLSQIERDGTPADQYKTGEGSASVAVAFFSYLMGNDGSGFSALWQQNAIHEVPFTFPGQVSTLNGKLAIIEYYRNRATPPVVFILQAVHQTLDPSCIVVEAFGSYEGGHRCAELVGRYVVLFRIEGGKIALCRVFSNPIVERHIFNAEPRAPAP